jgi:rRNA processing protein Krr1/Pno1
VWQHLTHLLTDSLVLLQSAKVSDEFHVPGSAVGGIIGKSGSNIRRVEEAHHVDILIKDDKVTITGDNAEDVANARRELELIEKEFTVSSSLAGLIIGRGGTTLKSIVEKTNVLNIDSKTNGDSTTFYIMGSGDAVDNARLLIEFHLNAIEGSAKIELEPSRRDTRSAYSGPRNQGPRSNGPRPKPADAAPVTAKAPASPAAPAAQPANGAPAAGGRRGGQQKTEFQGGLVDNVSAGAGGVVIAPKAAATVTMSAAQAAPAAAAASPAAAQPPAKNKTPQGPKGGNKGGQGQPKQQQQQQQQQKQQSAQPAAESPAQPAQPAPQAQPAAPAAAEQPSA